MRKKLIYIILLILYVLLLSTYSENFSPITLDVNLLDNGKFLFGNFNKLNRKDKYEILDLKYCDGDINVNYLPNTNYINNDNLKIYQDMSNSYNQEAYINGEKHNLVQIQWKKSYFTWDGKPVSLETHFVHVNPSNGVITKIIFPLSLHNQNTYIEKFTNGSDQTKLFSSNKMENLIKDTNVVPKKILGKINVGHMMTFNLCNVIFFVMNQKKFFYASTINNEQLLISKPQIFNREIGIEIFENLNEAEFDLDIPIKN